MMSVPAGQNRSTTFTFARAASSSLVGDRQSGCSRRNRKNFSEAGRIRELTGCDGSDQSVQAIAQIGQRIGWHWLIPLHLSEDGFIQKSDVPASKHVHYP